MDTTKSYMPSGKSIERKWYVIDAEGQTLGRLSSAVASILKGKNKPTYTPFLDRSRLQVRSLSRSFTSAIPIIPAEFVRPLLRRCSRRSLRKLSAWQLRACFPRQLSDAR